MAASKIPPLSKSRSIGHGRIKGTSVALALPKIVEQSGSTDEGKDATSSFPERDSKPCGSSQNGQVGRNGNDQGATIGPIIQKIQVGCSHQVNAGTGGKMEVAKNCKVKYGSRPRTRLGQDRLTQLRRPLTSTLSTRPQPECKLLLNISNIPTHHNKNSTGHTPSATSYQNEGFPSLNVASKSVIPEKSEIAGLCIGLQETWKVDSSSETPKRPRHKLFHGSHVTGAKAKQSTTSKTTTNLSPLHSSFSTTGFSTDNNTTKTFSRMGSNSTRTSSRMGSNSTRTSSRMGRNSLDQFLQNVNAESDLAHVKPKLRSDKAVKKTETMPINLSPLSNHESHFLQLKGFVRDPIRYHMIEGLQNFQEVNTSSTNKTGRSRTSRQSVNGRSLPSHLDSQKEPYSDVPMPLSSNLLDGAYHVFHYITS